MKPMCGPAAGGKIWKEMITRDVRRANLAKARKIKEEKKNGDICTSPRTE